MQILTIAATKGGVGKTTLTTGLAVQIAGEGLKVVMVDTDPQDSLENWFERRKDKTNMALIKNVDDVLKLPELLQKEGVDWLLIDTPPAMIEFIEPAIEIADFVLVPTKPGAFDITAIDPVVELCQQHRKPFAFIINMVIGAKSKMVKGAADYLSRDGRVLDAMVQNRSAYMAAALTGQSAPEIEVKGKSKEEVAALWLAVKKLCKRQTQQKIKVG